ncbi:hypothetical protein PK28_09895 [Hymenobacter sp. DG25B]|uniref:hypothetical protein n=1 Tax=Hymenobacter sp. DG25B TaxID=1385664 RepID=UPI0005412656|nr:hypothetical protein [Hymenobacter sp. DG25B]AIZ63917.1 hypothetical protein PK28_09895 [Hymenobacter sp. DG25B]
MPAYAQVAAPATAVSPPKPSIKKLMADARSLQRQYRESEALAKYEEVIWRDGKNVEALWQAALLSVRIGSRYTDETRKSLYYTAARGYAERSWALQPEAAEPNYVVALVLANQALLLHAKGRLQTYRDMKPYVFKAVARRPTWSEAWQLLGRWHYRVDHYNLLERIFSGLFLGGVPSGASSRQAIDALLKAQQLDPKRIQVYYDLARVYDTQKQDDKAIKVLQEAATLTPITTEELEISRRCRSLLTRLQRKHPPQSPGTGG